MFSLNELSQVSTSAHVTCLVSTNCHRYQHLLMSHVWSQRTVTGINICSCHMFGLNELSQVSTSAHVTCLSQRTVTGINICSCHMFGLNELSQVSTSAHVTCLVSTNCHRCQHLLMSHVWSQRTVTGINICSCKSEKVFIKSGKHLHPLLNFRRFSSF